MNFNLSELQVQLRDSAQRMLADKAPIEVVRDAETEPDGFPQPVWDEACALGWPGIALSEEWGGGGCGILDQCVLLEEIGRCAATLPFVNSSGLAGAILARLPASEYRNRLLREIAEGVVVSPALVDENGRNEWDRVRLPLVSKGNEYKLSGGKVLVPFASVARTLLITVSGPGDEFTIIALDARTDGIKMTRHHAAGGVPLFHMQFDNVAVTDEQILVRGEQGLAALGAGLEVGALLATAEAVGLCEGVIKLTAEYVTIREAFGQPIGAFQAVAHPVADLRIDTDAIRLLVREAAWLLDQGRSATIEVATTKAYANEAIERMVNDALRVHGAIGFSNEYYLQLFNRRLRAFCQAFGETSEVLERAAVASGI